MRYFALFIKKLLRYILKPLSFLPALAVMYGIFFFSSQDGISSGQLSYKISHEVVILAQDALDKDWSDERVESYTQRIHYYVRKTAHVTEYFMLAVTVAFPLYVYGVRGIWLVLFAGVFCVSFAALDEYHQSFVAGRGASAKDVAIDSIGILPGILLVRMVGFVGRKTVFRPLSMEKSKRKEDER